MRAAIMWRDLAPDVGSMQLGVGIGRVAVATAPAAEHHVAAMHCALVHLSQVHRAEVDLECALVTECLQTDIALDTLLSCCRIDKSCSKIFMESAVLSRAVVHAPSLWRHHVVLGTGHKVRMRIWWSVTSTALLCISNHVPAEIHWIVGTMTDLSPIDLFFEFTLAVGCCCCSCHCSLMEFNHRVVLMIGRHEPRNQAASK